MFENHKNCLIFSDLHLKCINLHLKWKARFARKFLSKMRLFSEFPNTVAYQQFYSFRAFLTQFFDVNYCVTIPTASQIFFLRLCLILILRVIWLGHDCNVIMIGWWLIRRLFWSYCSSSATYVIHWGNLQMGWYKSEVTQMVK